MPRIQRYNQVLALTFSRKDIGFMTIVLVALNVVDTILTFYAAHVLGFVELNPLAISFPFWIFILKFGTCFVPVVVAFVLDKFEMNNYLLLPFIFSAVLIEFYIFVVAFNVSNILELNI
ncbi:MAG: hypothetical protein ACM3X1_06640 [Ignavibacteriales bacterium]|nr:hypothetical protein [Candidatus Sulfotelmatobacter sp.]